MSLASPGSLLSFGWNDRVVALFAELSGLFEPARVTQVHRSACAVVLSRGERIVRAEPLPAVGDWIAVCDDRVVDVLPRWSELHRPDPDAPHMQVLAANVDVVLIAAPADRLNPSRVERELAVAWESGGRPVVVLTKSDLVDMDACLAGLDGRIVGADVIVTSSPTGAGIEELRQLLAPGRTAVLLGPSGAGKSTLVNALVGHEVLTTGEVRETDQRGRHTTTTRQMVTVPGGGVLIDTPGIRSLRLSGDEGIAATFADVGDLAAGCRFRDCQHAAEPGCAVTAAVSGGELDPARFASYRKLQRELAVEARKHDPFLRQAEQARWRVMSREGRLRARPRTR